MSKHNYSQYSNKNNNQRNQNQNNTPNRNVQQHKAIDEVKPAVKPVVMEETSPVARPSLVKETVETVTLPNTVNGTVAHCAKLNVREKPIVNSDIVCVLDVMSEIKIDVTKSTENWFYVICATGAEGYCMREYIDARM